MAFDPARSPMAAIKRESISSQAAESTADTFFPTNPAETMRSSSAFSSGLPAHREADDRPLDSTRISQLQQEAEMRAEHQAMARQTMLNLAHALDDSHARQRELARLLKQERDTRTDLESRCSEAERELEKMIEAEEKRMADELLQKCFKSGNKVFLSMMLEKSREIYKSSLFQPESCKSRRESTELPVNQQQPITPPALASDGSTPGVSPVADAGAEVAVPVEGTLVVPRHLSAQSSIPSQPLTPVGTSQLGEGDRITFSWIFKLWFREVQMKKERIAQEQSDRRKWSDGDEKGRRKREELEKAEAAAREMVNALSKQHETDSATIERQKHRLNSMERDLQTAMAEAAERDRAHEAAMALLKAELDKRASALLDFDALESKLRAELEAAREKFRVAESEHSSERQALQDIIQRISSELHEAVVLAKYMRETMLKCKRDVAASVSPAKFAELIAQLEEMTDQLNALRRDYNSVKDSNADLQQKVEKNRRRLELERQFLPLIRQARGPLGPKTGMNSLILAPAPLPEQSSAELPRKLQRSQSTASHNTGFKGFALAATTGSS